MVAAFVGYLGPSAFGLGAARFIQFGHIVAVLWVTMLLLGLLLIKLKPLVRVRHRSPGRDS